MFRIYYIENRDKFLISSYIPCKKIINNKKNKIQLNKVCYIYLLVNTFFIAFRSVYGDSRWF